MNMMETRLIVVYYMYNRALNG